MHRRMAGRAAQQNIAASVPKEAGIAAQQSIAASVPKEACIYFYI